MRRLIRWLLGIKEPLSKNALFFEIARQISIRDNTADYENTMLEMLMMQQKLDCLAKSIGVEVAANSDGEPFIEVVDNKLRQDAERSLKLSADIKALISAQRKLTEQSFYLFKRINDDEH